MSDSTSASRLERLSAMEDNHFWSVERDRLTRTLMDSFGMVGPVLDVGAGTGSFARSLLGHYDPVFWFDLVPTSPPGFAAHAEQIPFRDDSFQTILLRDVLEHVDDTPVVAECHRVLASGGWLLVTVPGWPSLWGPRDEGAGHLRRYRRRQLRDALESSGFEVSEIRGFQFLLLPLFVASRWLAKVTGPSQMGREERSVGVLGPVLRAVNRFEVGLARWRHPRPPTGSTLVAIASKR